MLKKIALTSLALSGLMMAPQKNPECCGIIGVVSQKPISEEEAQKNPKTKISIENFLCDGVNLLKNRGYDSAGIYRLGSQLSEGKLVKYAD
jgi:glucosamine 6-phosphate synthetase-like amidotransferase/phosphosugar isomerase protein